MKKIPIPKWLVGLAILPLVAIAVAEMFWGQSQKALGIFILFGSALLGGAGGEFLAQRLQKRLPQIGEKLRAAFSAFGFLFLPPLLCKWTNANLNTEIQLQSLGLHFLWAGTAACILFFAVGSKPQE